MKEFLTTHYPWRYEVVDKETINNPTGKYADTKKYPFAFKWRFSSNNTNVNDSRFSNWDLNGFFLDRTTKTDYPTTRRVNSYGNQYYKPFINSIVKHFKV